MLVTVRPCIRISRLGIRLAKVQRRVLQLWRCPHNNRAIVSSAVQLLRRW